MGNNCNRKKPENEIQTANYHARAVAVEIPIVSINRDLETAVEYD
jgi:hypothetical protein